MRVLIATDSFKGCLSSLQAGEAIARGVRKAGHEATVIPIADGGEGTLEAFARTPGAVRQSASTVDPLMRPVEAPYVSLPGGKALVESATAIGLTLVEPTRRNPLAVTSFGVGRLICEAIKEGAREVTVALGGTATNDAGLGALQALGARLYDRFGNEITTPATGADLNRVGAIDFRNLPHGLRINLLCDASIPFTGPHGAAQLYSAQKGADAAAMALLEEGMENVKPILERYSGISLDSIGGAAGGLEGGLLCAFGASRQSGIRALLESLDFRSKALEADLVITGEGKADCQTLQGKAAKGVLNAARPTPVILLAGGVSDRRALLEAGFADAVDINDGCDPAADPVQSLTARHRLTDATERVIERFCRNFS